MTTTRSVRWCSPAEIAVLLTPRDDEVMAEHRCDGADEVTHTFSQAIGPFAGYRRMVEVGAADSEGRVEVTESATARLAAPYWWPLGGFLVGRAIVRPSTDDEVQHRWWAPPCRLDVADVELMGRASVLAVVAGFLGGIIGQALTYIGSDLGAGASLQSRILAILRLGAVLTAVGLALADRFGRRRMILVTLWISLIANLVTALSPTLTWVTGSQVASRGFVAVGALLLPVLVAEQLPAGARAWCVGLLFMCGALGVGMVLWAFPFIDEGRAWWRGIFGLSVLCAPVLWRVGRRLVESDRYLARQVQVDAGVADRHRISRVRLAVLAVILLSVNLFVAPISQLQNEYLRTERGFSAATLTVFLILTNTWSGVTVLVAGRMADRRSRHLVAPIGMLGLVLGNVWMYSVGGIQMWLASFVGSFVGAATVPALGVLTPELFPTGRRGSAAGLINGVAIGGSIIGLLIAGDLIDRWGWGPTFATLGVVPLLAIPLLGLLPEGARVDLDVLNPVEPGAGDATDPRH